MTQFERLSIAAAFAAVITNLVLFVVFWLQLRQLKRQVQLAEAESALDHRQRRAQATIDYYRTTLEKRSELRSKLPHDSDAEGIRNLINTRLGHDGVIDSAVADYLAMFELLAAGVNTDVLELSVIDRLANRRIRDIAANYGPWIEHRRVELGHPRLCLELTSLATKLQLLESQRQDASPEVLEPR